ncbi:unnamed protein product [Cuscuta epithymum]|uniref:Oligopeptidase A N-terminal domain-containing protein n=1 Tax=Cuscuta epithymum TaxID=186058 RepID=A0AAV0D741_9ASTE|nr:unnamed protein product [Cuscuta epithymum]
MAIPADVEAYLSTLIRDAPSQFKREFEEFERTVEPTWPKLVEPFERFQYMFQRPTYKLEMVLSNADLEMDVVISDSPQLSSITEEVLQEIVSFKPRLYQSKPIYNAFKAIKKSAEWHALTDARKRIVDAQIKVAMLNGVSLENEEKERMNNIMRQKKLIIYGKGEVK